MLDYTKFGGLPKHITNIEIDTPEMMFWLYCPISMKDTDKIVIPKQLQIFRPLVDKVVEDLNQIDYPYGVESNYIYLTAKTVWVTPDNPGNRPGWHTDGFGTEDFNYIWCSNNPTLFLSTDSPLTLSASHRRSMEQMELEAIKRSSKIINYNPFDLLRLDHTIIHNSPKIDTPCYRTFVKISVSKEKYNLKGNSINHDLSYNWKYYDRDELRNHPTYNETDFVKD